ncbi:hypothetical protein KRP22_006761 [Phytophthora ramorum]|nr:Acid phosphatase [Phytophthora ramorum]
MWYSLNHGTIHFTSLSSETDYPNAPTNEYTLTNKIGKFGDQLGWIEADLKKADAKGANVPWIFVGRHRPIYSDLDSRGAHWTQPLLRAGLPIAKNKVIMDDVSDDYSGYDNPQAPVHILTEAAGQVEGRSYSPSNTASWNAVPVYGYFGYSTLEANRTRLPWKFILSSDQSVQDECVMYKTAAVQSESEMS